MTTNRCEDSSRRRAVKRADRTESKSSGLVKIDILDWLGDRLFFCLLEQLLKFGFQHLGFIFFGRSNLLVLFIPLGRFSLDVLDGVLQVVYQLRFGRQFMIENG
jgi:hypothetical protein